MYTRYRDVGSSRLFSRLSFTPHRVKHPNEGRPAQAHGHTISVVPPTSAGIPKEIFSCRGVDGRSGACTVSRLCPNFPFWSETVRQVAVE